jgi:hypothetical protein
VKESALGATKNAFPPQPIRGGLKFMQKQSAVDRSRDLFANQRENNFCCLVFLTSYKIDKISSSSSAEAATAAERGIWRFLHSLQPHIPPSREQMYIYKNVYSHVGSAFLQFVCVSGCHRLYNPPAFFIIYLRRFFALVAKYDVL